VEPRPEKAVHANASRPSKVGDAGFTEDYQPDLKLKRESSDLPAILIIALSPCIPNRHQMQRNPVTKESFNFTIGITEGGGRSISRRNTPPRMAVNHSFFENASIDL